MHDISDIFSDKSPVIILPVVMYCLDCWSQFPAVDMTGKSRECCVYCESTNIRDLSSGV